MSKISCAAAAMSLLLACDYQDPSQWIPPKIESFVATKPALLTGQGTTLIAHFSGESATVEPDVGRIESGVAIEVWPTSSTIYQLRVIGGRLQREEDEVATAAVGLFDGVFEVTSAAPSGAGSLTEVLKRAVASAGRNAIMFRLSLPAVIEPEETLLSSGDVSICGPGGALLTISGGGTRRLFFVREGSLSMSDLTLASGMGRGGAGGDARGFAGGGGGAAGMGGAMFINSGSVKLDRMILSGNAAVGGGGGRSTNGSTPYTPGGGGGFGGDGVAEVGGLGGDLDRAINGDGLGGNGGVPGGAGGFGGGGGGSNLDAMGCSTMACNGGAGGFGGGGGASYGGRLTPGGRFGGAGAASSFGGGGAGLGGAIFLREGELVVASSVFRGNRAQGGARGGGEARSGEGKGGAIFSMKPMVKLTDVEFSDSVAASAGASETDNENVYLEQ